LALGATISTHLGTYIRQSTSMGNRHRTTLKRRKPTDKVRGHPLKLREESIQFLTEASLGETNDKIKELNTWLKEQAKKIYGTKSYNANLAEKPWNNNREIGLKSSKRADSASFTNRATNLTS